MDGEMEGKMEVFIRFCLSYPRPCKRMRYIKKACSCEQALIIVCENIAGKTFAECY